MELDPDTSAPRSPKFSIRMKTGSAARCKKFRCVASGGSTILEVPLYSCVQMPRPTSQVRFFTSTGVCLRPCRAPRMAGCGRLVFQEPASDGGHGAGMGVETLVCRKSTGVCGQPLITACGDLSHRNALHEVEHRERRDRSGVPA